MFKYVGHAWEINALPIKYRITPGMIPFNFTAEIHNGWRTQAYPCDGRFRPGRYGCTTYCGNSRETWWWGMVLCVVQRCWPDVSRIEKNQGLMGIRSVMGQLAHGLMNQWHIFGCMRANVDAVRMRLLTNAATTPLPVMWCSFFKCNVVIPQFHDPR